ncbi:MAG: class I SAM-dependent methyltransferase [Candidatus Thorarchaeota archaeon]|nr:class I SAM-dependent methyltransferase [Candidatus Thorarchaeota archaeon]MCK5238096.1 class I SAM-dependent methyltransferase [Candidatus Thorarchaeota archaeon]
MSDHHERPSEDEVFILPPQVINLEDFECGDDWILDIGSGGEGVIALLKGRQVVGIDRNKSELEELQNESLNIIMDATDLNFLDASFSTATVFFTFMYMKWETIEKALNEIWRVLQPGGQVRIWDAICSPPDNSEKKYFMIPLEVNYPDGKKIQTGYGAHLRKQSMGDFISKIEEKFKILKSSESESHFYLHAEKIG